jgi:hypothetical protein
MCPSRRAAPASGRHRWHEADREASRGASRTAAELPEQILAEAEAIDRAKDADDRGGDLKDSGADEAMGSSAWSRPRSAPWPAR